MKLILFVSFSWLILSFEISTCSKSDVANLKGINSNENGHPIFQNPELTPFLSNPEFEIQIRYTQIDRDENNIPKFTPYSWNENENYFYPASTVKMPVAFAALQKFNEIKEKTPCLSIHDPFIAKKGTLPQNEDTIHPYLNQKPSLFEHIRLVFSVSDNNAYNRLYEFAGQEYINKTHREKGIFTNSHVIHRVGVGGYDYNTNQYHNPFTIYGKDCKYDQPEIRSIAPFTIKQNSQKGIGYINNDTLVNAPFDFSQKNFVSLKDLESSLMRIIFPNAFPENQKYNLKEADYQLLYKILDELPRDIPYLKSDTSYYDTYVKFFYSTNKKQTIIPDHIHIFNKVGFAYGTLTDCSYIFDTKSGAEFFLTATILVNKNNIFNDGIYEYDKVGIPFLANLGMKVLDYEQNRNRKNKPDFKAYLTQ
jgi:hypothetical protein